MDIEETRNAYLRATQSTDEPIIITAQRCPICHYPQEPELIELVSDQPSVPDLPEWEVIWHCGNTYLHRRIAQQKDNQNA
jgi:hypothetical protein